MIPAPTNTPQLNPGQDVYAHVEALACEIERDEQAIKDALLDALEKGQTASALKILKAWRTTPPREIVTKYLEAGYGNSN